VFENAACYDTFVYQEEFLDNIQCDIQSLARQTRANDLFAMALRKTDPPLVS
jgi:hypothetical protein